MDRRPSFPKTLGPGGQYRLGTMLWRDDLGTVWHANDRLFGRPVSIRLLRQEVVADPELRAELAATLRDAFFQLRHSHVARVLTHFVDAEGGFIVMEPLRAIPLVNPLPAHLQISAADLVRFTAETFAALAHAHDRGIVHGFLAPTSAVLTAASGSKLLDFGLLPIAALRRQEQPTPAGDVAALAWIFRDLTFQPGIVLSLPDQLAFLLKRSVDPNPAGRPSASEISDAAARTMDASTRRAFAIPLPDVRSIDGGPASPPYDAETSTKTEQATPVKRVPKWTAVLLGLAVLMLVAFAAVRASSDRDPGASKSPGSTGVASVDSQRTTVPDVLGLRPETAAKRLTAARLQVARFVSVAGRSDTVVRTDPTAGEAVRSGTAVTVFVGGGSAPA